MCEVLEFRLLNRSDIFDKDYLYWSRIYEYPMVKKYLQKLGATEDSTIHNTCWGFEGVHVMFKDYLDSTYDNVLHSDIKKSELKNTFVYDITGSSDEKYKNYFDFVINISTIEEVNYPNDIIINNLLDQTKPGGYLIVTFDYRKDVSGYQYNSMDVKTIESIFNVKLTTSDNDIPGLNSEFPEERNKLLQCGILVIKKSM